MIFVTMFLGTEGSLTYKGCCFVISLRKMPKVLLVHITVAAQLFKGPKGIAFSRTKTIQNRSMATTAFVHYTAHNIMFTVVGTMCSLLHFGMHQFTPPLWGAACRGCTQNLGGCSPPAGERGVNISLPGVNPALQLCHQPRQLLTVGLLLNILVIESWYEPNGC